jgi:hypothetical protein
MTPKEKAEQLINKFFFDTMLDELEDAKDCALIAVDEIKEFMSPMVHSKQAYDYWEEVKQEIEKL